MGTKFISTIEIEFRDIGPYRNRFFLAYFQKGVVTMDLKTCWSFLNEIILQNPSFFYQSHQTDDIAYHAHSKFQEVDRASEIN